MNEIQLKFPEGEFTHSELATLNGKTNQQVWVAYQQAIKDGVIVPAGERKNSAGRGKPSKLWKLNSEKGIQPTKVPAQPIQSEPRTVVRKPIQPVVKVEEPTEEVIEKIVEKKIQNMPEPVMAMLVSPVIPPDEDTPARTFVPEPVVSKRETLEKSEIHKDKLCPVCKHPLYSIPTKNGVMIWCAQGPKVCPPQDVSYYERNVKLAYEGLVERWQSLTNRNK